MKIRGLYYFVCISFSIIPHEKCHHRLSFLTCVVTRIKNIKKCLELTYDLKFMTCTTFLYDKLFLGKLVAILIWVSCNSQTAMDQYEPMLNLHRPPNSKYNENLFSTFWGRICTHTHIISYTMKSSWVTDHISMEWISNNLETLVPPSPGLMMEIHFILT